MATEITTYVASDGRTFTDNELAQDYQRALNRADNREDSEQYFDAYLKAASTSGNSRMWGVLNRLANTKSRKLLIQRSNLGEIMNQLIDEDLEGLFGLAAGLAMHTYEFPKSFGRLDENGDPIVDEKGEAMLPDSKLVEYAATERAPEE